MAIAEDRAKPAAIFVSETIDVATIRKSQKLSQEGCAKQYDLSAGTIKD